MIRPIENDYIEDTILPGVFIITRPTFEDPRGFFRETYQKKGLDTRTGFGFEPVQANRSRSQKHTLRGIHIAPWHKLVSVLHGTVQQVIVDTREDSPAFGKHISVQLGEYNWKSVFVPAGCGNAFLVTSDTADYSYLTTDYWAPGKEQYVVYNDPELGIIWNTDQPLISDKDMQNPPLSKLLSNS